MSSGFEEIAQIELSLFVDICSFYVYGTEINSK